MDEWLVFIILSYNQPDGVEEKTETNFIQRKKEEKYFSHFIGCYYNVQWPWPHIFLTPPPSMCCIVEGQ